MKPIALEIPDVSHIYIYSMPISMQLGEKKLIQLCKNEMGLDPSDGLVFLFFNQIFTKIKLFYVDNTGSFEITKGLVKGGFLLPVSNDGQNYIKIESHKLASLFRSPIV